MIDRARLGHPFILIAIAISVTVAGPPTSHAGPSLWSGRYLLDDPNHQLAYRFDTFAAVPDDPRGRIAYGTDQGKIHLLENVEGSYREIWVSQAMRAMVREVICADLPGTGEYALIAYTTRGDLSIYDIESHGILWRAGDTEFRSIEKLTVGQVDNDRQLELIFLSEGRLYIYDGRHFLEEWRSNIVFDATDIAVGDVDGDDEPEIVLSSGHVLDGRTRAIEWESPDAFGDFVELADVDGDGKAEIIGGTPTTTIIWDADQRRKKWD